MKPKKSGCAAPDGISDAGKALAARMAMEPSRVSSEQAEIEMWLRGRPNAPLDLAEKWDCLPCVGRSEGCRASKLPLPIDTFKPWST